MGTALAGKNIYLVSNVAEQTRSDEEAIRGLYQRLGATLMSEIEMPSLAAIGEAEVDAELVAFNQRAEAVFAEDADEVVMVLGHYKTDGIRDISTRTNIGTAVQLWRKARSEQGGRPLRLTVLARKGWLADWWKHMSGGMEVPDRIIGYDSIDDIQRALEADEFTV